MTSAEITEWKAYFSIDKKQLEDDAKAAKAKAKAAKQGR